jgi:DNA-binding response OmpR family regulator
MVTVIKVAIKLHQRNPVITKINDRNNNPKCFLNVFVPLIKKTLKILIIEDEEGLRESIEEYFSESGNVCESASSYQSALAKINIYRYDCILLDISLPDGNGMDVLKSLKENNHADGVLIISAKNSLDDRLNGLNLGADDYLVKPFHLSELKARVTAIIRRKTFNGSNLLLFNEITIDLLAKEVKVDNAPVKLTRKEYALLLYFIANKGKVVSKNAIAEHLWGDGIDMANNFDFIYSHIKNIRKKLMEAGCKDYIQAAYGMGYKFTDQ